MIDSNGIDDERVRQAISNLPEGIREKAMAATSLDELRGVLNDNADLVDLSEEELRWVSGGCSAFDAEDFERATEKVNEIIV